MPSSRARQRGREMVDKSRREKASTSRKSSSTFHLGVLFMGLSAALFYFKLSPSDWNLHHQHKRQLREIIMQNPVVEDDPAATSTTIKDNSGSNTTTTGPSPLQSSSSCPLAVQNNIGIYKNDDNHKANDKFDNVILLVACNYAYYDLLQNWEYLANQLDLKWAVLALDEELYKVLGPERAISPGGDFFSVSGPQTYGEKGDYHKLSCNKMRMVMDITNHCGGAGNNGYIDIVFTDVDNIFLKDPFQHDLGRLIASGKYDYLYQPNHETPNQPLVAECLRGDGRRPPEKGGNTGFYYLKGNLREPMKTIIEQTLWKCFEPNNKFDDQTLFWRELWQVMDHNNNNKTVKSTLFHHCNVSEYLDPGAAQPGNASATTSLNLCCLDPYHYPVGKCPQGYEDPSDDKCPPHNKDPITYHANWCTGKKAKINKLHNSRNDGYGWPFHFCSLCLLDPSWGGYGGTTCQMRADYLADAYKEKLSYEDAIQATLHEQPINCNDQHHKQTRTIITAATTTAIAAERR